MCLRPTVYLHHHFSFLDGINRPGWMPAADGLAKANIITLIPPPVDPALALRHERYQYRLLKTAKGQSLICSC